MGDQQNVLDKPKTYEELTTELNNVGDREIEEQNKCLVVDCKPDIEEEIVEDDYMRYLFNKYDTNKDGKLSLKELVGIINSKKYERDIPPCAIKNIFNLSDTDKNGEIDFNEFVAMVNDPELKSIFGHFISRYVNYLVPQRRIYARRPSAVRYYEDYYNCSPPAIYMLVITLIEFGFYFCDSALLKFDPKHKNQIWRYISYMLAHSDWLHLIFNLAIQIILGKFN